jgi:hypothetical protein
MFSYINEDLDNREDEFDTLLDFINFKKLLKCSDLSVLKKLTIKHVWLKNSIKYMNSLVFYESESEEEEEENEESDDEKKSIEKNKKYELIPINKKDFKISKNKFTKISKNNNKSELVSKYKLLNNKIIYVEFTFTNIDNPSGIQVGIFLKIF